MRENKEDEMDLDTTTSIATTMACISVGSASLLIFRSIR